MNSFVGTDVFEDCLEPEPQVVFIIFVSLCRSNIAMRLPPAK
jgi:hypothetical protein